MTDVSGQRSSRGHSPRTAARPQGQARGDDGGPKVGIFGVGNAGHWGGRAGALLVRLSQCYSPSKIRALWILLCADDGKATAGGHRFQLSLLNHLFFLEVLGTPMKWRKVRGGVQVEWVRYLIDYSRFEMGITES